MYKKRDDVCSATKASKLKSDMENLKNEKSVKDLRKPLEVERKARENVQKVVVDARTKIEGLKLQVNGLESEVRKLKTDKISLGGEIEGFKKKKNFDLDESQL